MFLLVITLSVIQHNNGEDPAAAAASRDRHHVYCIILFTIFLDKLVLSNLDVGDIP